MILKRILRGWRMTQGFAPGNKRNYKVPDTDYFLPKAPLAILHPRRIILEIGLFSGLSKPKVNEYIAATRNRRGRKTFATESP